jgi:hypothetical protein
MSQTKVRCTFAAQRFGLRPSTVSLAKQEGRISDPGHGYCYLEEVAEMGRRKALIGMASRAKADYLAKRAADMAKSIDYDEAAALYGTTADQVVKWKYAKILKGPTKRIWKGQSNPKDRPNYGPGLKTLGGGASYRVYHRPPRIDPNDAI